MRDNCLGAVLAGGQSTRFGSDKAAAVLNGVRLLDLAVEALTRQCRTVAVIGRNDPHHACAPDWPKPGMGPLAGLAGALLHAVHTGHDMVLSCGVDSLDLPGDLLERLSPAPSYLASQPVIGLWPVNALPAAQIILMSDERHSVRAFAERIGASAVILPAEPRNVNNPADMHQLKQAPTD